MKDSVKNKRDHTLFQGKVVLDLGSTSTKESSNILYYGLLLIFILEYIRPGTYWPFLIKAKVYSVIPICVFILSLLATKGKFSTTEIFETTNGKYLLFLLSLTMISLFTSDDASFANQIFTTCLGYIFLFFIIQKNISTIGQLEGAFIALIFCHIFLIIMNFEVISDPSTRSYIKNSPFLGDGNDFALSLCIVVPFCLYLLTNEHRRLKKTVYLFVIIMLILAIIGTSSRGGTLALFSVLLYLGVKSKKRVKWLMHMFFIICLIFAYAPPLYFSRIENINNPQESSAQGRINAWKAAIKMAQDNPILGVGAGHFVRKYAMEYKGENFIMTKTAHSMYFLALGELGFPGLFFLIGFILSNLIKNEKIIRQITKEHTNNNYQADASLMIYLNASLIGFSVAGAFLSVLYYPHIFILAGLLGVGRTIVKNHLGETSPTKIFSSR